MHNKQLAENHLISETPLWDFIFHSAVEQMYCHLSAVGAQEEKGMAGSSTFPAAFEKMKKKKRRGGESGEFLKKL